MTDRYGNEDLGRGSTRHEQVQTLQRDLRELGFWIVGPADGIFGRNTFWAVREFQAYARMDHVAHETGLGDPVYADRLTAVATGEHRYRGPISGVANAATCSALEHWLDSRWRCPVVVEAWKTRGAQRDRLSRENIWLHDEVRDPSLRMFVRDRSGYFLPVNGNGTDDRIIVGDYSRYLSWSGPRSTPPRHSWPEAEITPERFIGHPFDQLSPAQVSTFKAVRAVSEVECIGHFDSVNAYDNAFVSVGPCHWTLGIASNGGNVSEGELAAFLAYLGHADRPAFDKLLTFFGVRVDGEWTDAKGLPSGAPFYDRTQRKYTGWLAMQRDDGGYARLPEREGEGDYFKTWHWFYRFVMAGRTVAGYQRGMWDMARIRLRDLADLPWGEGRPAADTLGSIFTSEKAMAMILRWHVRYPCHIASRSGAAPRLRAVLAAAENQRPELDWTAPPAAWTGAHEAALLAALRTAVGAVGGDLAQTIAQVDHWPHWANGRNPRRFRLPAALGPLSEARDSFRFDRTGLPPAP
jgi:hypothetical protein